MISVVLLPLWINLSAVRQSHWSCLRLIQHQRTLRFISPSLSSCPLGSYLTSVFNTSNMKKTSSFHQLHFPSNLLVQQGSCTYSCLNVSCFKMQEASGHLRSGHCSGTLRKGYICSMCTLAAEKDEEELVFGDLRLVSVHMLTWSIIFNSFPFLFNFDF